MYQKHIARNINRWTTNRFTVNIYWLWVVNILSDLKNVPSSAVTDDQMDVWH